jgi:uncharacterized protein YndB with AHSA1/START domain
MATLVPRDPDWIATAPLVVRRTRAVAAPSSAVWSMIADHERWTEWFGAVSSVRVTGAAEGVGGTRTVKIPGMTIDEEFTAWEPERRFAFTVVRASPTLRSLAESVELEPSAGGCTVTYTQGIEPARGFGWMWKLISRRMGSELTKALDNLAAGAEATATERD